MDMTALLKQLQQQPDYRDQIVHVHQIDARPPRHW